MQKIIPVRRRVWRNMVVAGLNAAVAQRRLTLKPGPVSDALFTFTLAGLPAHGCVEDIGSDEVKVKVIVSLGASGRHHPPWHLPGRRYPENYCEAWAEGWLERRTDPHLMTGVYSLGVARHLLPALAAVAVEPDGYTSRMREAVS